MALYSSDVASRIERCRRSQTPYDRRPRAHSSALPVFFFLVFCFVSAAAGAPATAPGPAPCLDATEHVSVAVRAPTEGPVVVEAGMQKYHSNEQCRTEAHRRCRGAACSAAKSACPRTRPRTSTTTSDPSKTMRVPVLEAPVAPRSPPRRPAVSRCADHRPPPLLNRRPW